MSNNLIVQTPISATSENVIKWVYKSEIFMENDYIKKSISIESPVEFTRFGTRCGVNISFSDFVYPSKRGLTTNLREFKNFFSQYIYKHRYDNDVYCRLLNYLLIQKECKFNKQNNHFEKLSRFVKFKENMFRPSFKHKYCSDLYYTISYLEISESLVIYLESLDVFESIMAKDLKKEFKKLNIDFDNLSEDERLSKKAIELASLDLIDYFKSTPIKKFKQEGDDDDWS